MAQSTSQEVLNGLIQLFTQTESPKELAEDLIQLLFNYASLIDESTVNEFKKDVATIYILYNELNK